VDTSARVGGIEGGSIFRAGLQVVEQLLDGLEGGFDAGVEKGDRDFGAEEVDAGVFGVLIGYCFDRRVRVDGISIPSGGGIVADEGGHFVYRFEFDVMGVDVSRSLTDLGWFRLLYGCCC
jgi:hypothetical protein